MGKFQMNFKLKKISGDASNREFFRLKKGDKTSIIVQATKDKHKNLLEICQTNIKICAKFVN